MGANHHEFWKGLGFKPMTVYLPAGDDATYYDCKVKAGRGLMELAKDPDTPDWMLRQIGGRRALGVPDNGVLAATADRLKKKSLKNALAEAQDLMTESKKAIHVAINHAQSDREVFEQAAYGYACNFTAYALVKFVEASQ